MLLLQRNFILFDMSDCTIDVPIKKMQDKIVGINHVHQRSLCLISSEPN